MNASCRDSPADDAAPVDVSIVMPCLDEALCLAVCVANARALLDMLSERMAMRGEIVVADNGSADGSPDIAAALGARVVRVSRRGYGARSVSDCFSGGDPVTRVGVRCFSRFNALARAACPQRSHGRTSCVTRTCRMWQ